MDTSILSTTGQVSAGLMAGSVVLSLTDNTIKYIQKKDDVEYSTSQRLLLLTPLVAGSALGYRYMNNYHAFYSIYGMSVGYSVGAFITTVTNNYIKKMNNPKAIYVYVEQIGAAIGGVICYRYANY